MIENKKELHRLRLLPSVVLTVIVILNLVARTTWIPYNGLLSSDAMMVYVLNLVSVVLSLVIVFVGIKLFSSKAILRQMRELEEDKAWTFYLKRCKSVVVLQLVIVVIDFVISYLLNDISAMWCALMVAIASYFSVPSEDKFKKLRTPETEK